MGSVLKLLALSTVAFAQFRDSFDQIGFAANLNIGDSEINISNDGFNGGFYNNNMTGLGAGNICVNVYVFDPSEEEIACCSCLVTPNALLSLSAKNSLIADVLTPAIPTSIVIKLVSTLPGTATGGVFTVCKPTVPFGVLPGGGGVALGTLAWGTTLEPAPLLLAPTAQSTFLSSVHRPRAVRNSTIQLTFAASSSRKPLASASARVVLSAH
jgi:hypothetical protein